MLVLDLILKGVLAVSVFWFTVEFRMWRRGQYELFPKRDIRQWMGR